MAAHMEELSAELDDLAASIANPSRKGGGGSGKNASVGSSGGTGSATTSEDELVSQLSRSLDAEDWGSIADILKSIENTSQGRPARLSPQHHRLTPLSENIQCSVPPTPTPPTSPTGIKPDGKGMQQLDHLLGMMEQMCALQKQNSKLREQAEYLTAIKNLQELRNETLMENCHCGAQHRSMDPCGGVRFEPLQMPEETLSEPESQIGDDMNATRQRRNSRARSIKRDAKSRNMKKRSRSADPFSDRDKDTSGSRERSRVGIFSKFEKMKEKLTTRRGSVKRHPPKGRFDDEAHREAHRRMELSTDGSMQMDVTETKSEDSGIYHVEPSEALQKSQEDFSDNEEVFSTPPLAPTAWGKPSAFASEGRKNSDFSTGSSSEDYLELKPKRHPPHGGAADAEGAVVYRRRRKDLSPHRLKNSEYDGESRTKLVRRSASFQDNVSLSDDDYEDANSQWESKEAPAVLQPHMTLHQSHSIPIMDSSKHHRLYDQRANSSEMKASQKRKHLHRSHQVDEVDSPCNGEQRPYSVDFLTMKNASPPDKKRPKGWEKVKHAVSRKHGPDSGNKKGYSEFYTELSAEDHEALAAAEGAILTDRIRGSEERIGGRPTQKRYKESGGGGQSGGSTGTSSTSLAVYESLQANISDDFTKKMEKWDRRKPKKGVQLEKTKQTSLDSASSDATSHSPAVLEELQKNLSDDFTKKMLEWDRKKQRTGNSPHSPPTQPKRKQGVKEKAKVARPGSKIIKHKGNVRGKESPQVRRRSQSPEGRSKAAPFTTEEIYSKENMALIEREDGELHLEGVSKEFNRRYKEWERIKKMAVKHEDERGDHEMDPKDSRRVAIIEQNKSSTSDSGDVYLVAHATPVIVEPEFDPANFQSQEAGSQAEFSVSEKSNRTASSMGDDSVFGDSTPPEDSGEQVGAGLNRLEQRNSLLAEQLKHKDVNLQAVSDELQNMQEQISRITGEKHEMRRVSVCSSLGESALEAELIDIKSQIQQLEEQFENYPSGPLKRRSRDEVRGHHHKRRHGSRGKGDPRGMPVGKVDESTSTDAIPEKIEVEVQTNDPDLPPSPPPAAEPPDGSKQQDPESPTTQLKKCLHEREAIIMLLQAEVDRQANELNYLRSGDPTGAFRRAKSFSARDRKTFDMRAMRVVGIALDKSDKLEDLAEKADEMPELPSKRLDEFAVTLREKSDTLSSRSSQDSKRESLMSVMSSSTTQSLETLHISAEDIRMEESGGSEASDKLRSLRSQASDTSSLETKSEPIRKGSLDRKHDRREQEQESSPESAISLLRKRCNRDNLEILPSKRDISSKSDVRSEEGKEKDNANIRPTSPSRLNKVSPQFELVKLGQRQESQSAENSPKSPRRLVNVNHSPLSGSPVHLAKKWECLSDSNRGSTESLGSKEGKSLVQERKELFAIRGRLEKSASLDSTQIIEPHSRTSEPGGGRAKRKLSTDSTNSSLHRRAVSQWVDRSDPVISKSKKPEDKSVNNLRKKFTNTEYGSAPNMSQVGHQSLKDKYTPRTRREAPKQGCVRQLSQAFSMVSLMEGEQQQRRGSQSSSVKSSPRSLSPASSTNSLVANQIKKLQDKATSGSNSDVSSSRRQSVEASKSSTRESSPVPGSSPLVGRREYRQSLPNIAAVRAKFDKGDDKTDNKESDKSSADKSIGDSSIKTIEDSTRIDNRPSRSRTAPANRITYKVSVVNDDKEKPSVSLAKDMKSETPARVRSSRLVAVIETPPEKEEDEGTVTFTLKPNPSRGRKVNSSLHQTSKDTSSNSNSGKINSSLHQTSKDTSSNSNSGKINSSLHQTSKDTSSNSNSGKINSSLHQTSKDTSSNSNSGKINSSLHQTSKNTSSNGNSGNVRRKTQMFTATVEETTTVIKKAKSEVKKEEKKEVTVEVKAVRSRMESTRPMATSTPKTATTSKSSPDTKIQVSATSSVRPKETKPSGGRSNQSASSDAKSNGKEETSARARRRRREHATSASTSHSPSSRSHKTLETPTTHVQSSGKSPDRRGPRNRNRKDLKSPDSESKKSEPEKQEKQERVSGRGGRRERDRRDANTKTDLTDSQRREAILARRERREAREARDGAKVERKDSKKEKTSDGVEKKESKNTKGDKKVSQVEQRDSNKSKRESVKVDRKDSKTKKDVRLQRTESDLQNDKKDTDSPLRSLRRRKSKRDELSTPSTEFDSTSEGASGNSEFGDSTSQGSDYPDLLANTRRSKKEATRSDSRGSRCARAVVAQSALKGAEALIGTQLPKQASEEDPNERKSRKDKSSRRGRAINRADRISRLDLFRRARSVDSSKVTKDRSPSTERGKSDRAQSVDRTSKKRESSMDRQKGGDGKNWLSKRTGSITNFLRASNEALQNSIDSTSSDDDDDGDSDDDSNHANSSSHIDCSLDCCHQDSGFHENAPNNALHGNSDGDSSDDDDSDDCSSGDKSCDISCGSMYDRHSAVSDLQVAS